MLKATRSESNVNDPANENVNSPINPKLDTNLDTNETKTNTDQTATFTPQNATIHLTTQPNLARTNKKKQRQYHEGRTRESNCVYTDLVVNLSNYQLNNGEIKVLAKGLKFIPSPRNINKTEASSDIKKCIRRMRLKEYFHDINKATDSDASNTNELDYEKREFESPPFSQTNPTKNQPLICILSTWKKHHAGQASKKQI